MSEDRQAEGNAGSIKRGARMQGSKGLRIFPGSSNPELAARIADHLGVPLGRIKLSRFRSGEIYVHYEESVRNCDVFLIQSLSHPVNDHFVELLIMIDA